MLNPIPNCHVQAEPVQKHPYTLKRQFSAT
jgi:hypothetical protein